MFPRGKCEAADACRRLLTFVSLICIGRFSIGCSSRPSRSLTCLSVGLITMSNLEKLMHSMRGQPSQPPSVSITKDGSDVILYDSSARPSAVLMPSVIRHRPPMPPDSASVVDLVKDITKKSLSVMDTAGNSLETEMSPQTVAAKNCARFENAKANYKFNLLTLNNCSAGLLVVVQFELPD